MLTSADSLDDFYERVLDILEADEAYRLDTSRSISPESDVDRILDHADAERFHGGDLTLIKLFSVRATTAPVAGFLDASEESGLLSFSWRPKGRLENGKTQGKCDRNSVESLGNLCEDVTPMGCDALTSNCRVGSNDDFLATAPSLDCGVDSIESLAHQNAEANLIGVSSYETRDTDLTDRAGCNTPSDFNIELEPNYDSCDVTSPVHGALCSNPDVLITISPCDRLTCTNDLNKFTPREERNSDQLRADYHEEFHNVTKTPLLDTKLCNTLDRSLTSSLESLDQSTAFDKAISYLANRGQVEQTNSQSFEGDGFQCFVHAEELDKSISSNSLNVFESNPPNSCSNQRLNSCAPRTPSPDIHTDFSEAFDNVDGFSFSTLNSMNSVLMTVKEMMSKDPETDTDSCCTDLTDSEESLNLTMFDSQYSTDYDSEAKITSHLRCPPFSIQCSRNMSRDGSSSFYCSCEEADVSFESILALQAPETTFDQALENLSEFFDDSASNFSASLPHRDAHYHNLGSKMVANDDVGASGMADYITTSANIFHSRHSSCEAIIADDTSDYSYPEVEEPEVELFSKSETEDDVSSDGGRSSHQRPSSSEPSFVDLSTDDALENDSDNSFSVSAATSGLTDRSRKRFFRKLLAAQSNNQHGRYENRDSALISPIHEDALISPIEDFDDDDDDEYTSAMQSFETTSFFDLMDLSHDRQLLVQPIPQSTNTDIIQFAKTSKIPKIPQ